MFQDDDIGPLTLRSRGWPTRVVCSISVLCSSWSRFGGTSGVDCAFKRSVVDTNVSQKSDVNISQISCQIPFLSWCNTYCLVFSRWYLSGQEFFLLQLTLDMYRICVRLFCHQNKKLHWGVFSPTFNKYLHTILMREIIDLRPSWDETAPLTRCWV